MRLRRSAQNDDLTKSIRLLNTLARKLKAKRMKAGALNLASPEVKIHMESAESSDPIDVKQKELMETNSLVEEFMLLANISVATKIHETFPLTAVLRRVFFRLFLPCLCPRMEIRCTPKQLTFSPHNPLGRSDTTEQLICEALFNGPSPALHGFSVPVSSPKRVYCHTDKGNIDVICLLQAAISRPCRIY